MLFRSNTCISVPSNVTTSHRSIIWKGYNNVSRIHVIVVRNLEVNIFFLWQYLHYYIFKISICQETDKA